jgi:hypothetical protein
MSPSIRHAVSRHSADVSFFLPSPFDVSCFPPAGGLDFFALMSGFSPHRNPPKKELVSAWPRAPDVLKFGNPAVPKGPAAFRPTIARGLAFRSFYHDNSPYSAIRVPLDSPFDRNIQNQMISGSFWYNEIRVNRRAVLLRTGHHGCRTRGRDRPPYGELSFLSIEGRRNTWPSFSSSFTSRGCGIV